MPLRGNLLSGRVLCTKTLGKYREPRFPAGGSRGRPLLNKTSERVGGKEALDFLRKSSCGLTMNNVYSRNRHCWLPIA